MGLFVIDKARECQRCGLCKTRKQVVFAHGNRERGILLVGEGPGGDEDALGKPFVGAAGKMLRRWMSYLGLKRKRDYMVTNIVKCFTGDVSVLPAGTSEKMFRRWYDGELIELRTANHKLTGTPNHPILTPLGWLSLGSFVEGDYITSGIPRQEVLGRDPYVDDVPVPFEQLADSLRDLWIRKRIVGGDVDFHGDGMRQGEIDVVSPDRELWNGFQTEDSQHLCEDCLAAADHRSVLLQRSGATDQFSSEVTTGLRFPTDSRMRRLRELESFLSGESRHSQSVGVGLSSNVDAFFEKEQPKAGLPHTGLPHTSLTTQSLSRFASNVAFEEVLEVRRRTFSGHVYNLQTTGGWYTANGIISSNCRPPGNRIPTPDEIAACARWFSYELNHLRPWLVIPLGATAAKVILDDENFTITKNQGFIYPKMLAHLNYHTNDNVIVFPLLHPAYILRNPIDEPKVYKKLDFFKKAVLRKAPDAA